MKTALKIVLSSFIIFVLFSFIPSTDKKSTFLTFSSILNYYHYFFTTLGNNQFKSSFDYKNLIERNNELEINILKETFTDFNFDKYYLFITQMNNISNIDKKRLFICKKIKELNSDKLFRITNEENIKIGKEILSIIDIENFNENELFEYM